jgi:hypothetical protein
LGLLAGTCTSYDIFYIFTLTQFYGRSRWYLALVTQRQIVSILQVKIYCFIPSLSFRAASRSLFKVLAPLGFTYINLYCLYLSTLYQRLRQGPRGRKILNTAFSIDFQLNNIYIKIILKLFETIFRFETECKVIISSNTTNQSLRQIMYEEIP